MQNVLYQRFTIISVSIQSMNCLFLIHFSENACSYVNQPFVTSLIPLPCQLVSRTVLKQLVTNSFLNRIQHVRHWHWHHAVRLLEAFQVEQGEEVRSLVWSVYGLDCLWLELTVTCVCVLQAPANRGAGGPDSSDASDSGRAWPRVTSSQITVF